MKTVIKAQCKTKFEPGNIFLDRKEMLITYLLVHQNCFAIKNYRTSEWRSPPVFNADV